MKLMNKFMKKREGFTLVELIVVIAILAILAGVAVPVYSGYIKKANSAADLQLLDAVNTAFAAACLANGVDARDIEDAMFNKNTMKVSNVELNGTVNTEIAADFDTYFAGNAEAEFKTYIGLTFSDGRFVEGSGRMTAEQIQAAVDRYNTSNFAGNEEALVGSVGTLSGMLAEQIEGDSVNLEVFMTDYDDFVAKYGLTDKSTGTETANATIMYTASKLQGVTAQDIIDLTDGDLNNIDEVIETYGAIPTAAMMYGVISGYANSEYASDDFKETYQTPPTGISDVTNLVGTMTSDPNFNTYLNKSGESGATADMDGFLAAMDIINAHDGSFDLSDPDLFTDDEMLNLLNGILGK